MFFLHGASLGEERKKKKEESADKNRSPSTIARTGPFCYSRAWKPLTPIMHNREMYLVRLLYSKLMQSRLIFRRNRVIFDQCSKRYYWSVKGHSEPPFVRCFPIRKFVLNISPMAARFHGIRPPFVVQTWLQQYRRCPLFHSANCSFSNSSCFWSVWCWRTMIQDSSSQEQPNSKDLSVYMTFGFLEGSRNFIRFFLVSFVICSNQVPEIFRSWHDCTSASSTTTRSPCYFGLQAHSYAYRNLVPRRLAASLENHGTNWQCVHFSASGLPTLFVSTFINQILPEFL